MPADIGRDEVQRLAREGAQIVEVLPAHDYAEQGHLPGAINIPLKELNRASAHQLDPARPVIVYCFDFQ